jgi:hypothetical protein
VTDTAAPTAPAALLVASGDTTAALSWTPASDNTTVTGYYIYRWQAAPIDATYTNPHARIATLSAGVTSYADSGLTNAGTYYYEVRAFDAATNVGPRATGSAAPVIAAPSVSTVPTSPDGDDGWYKTKPIVTIHTGATRTTLYSFQAIPSSWTTYTAPIEIPEGLSTLKYLDTDGVSMGTSATLSFKVDSIKPTASVSAPAISVPTSKDKTIVVSWQGADAGSGVERFQVQSRILPSGTWEDGYETTETAAYFTGDAGANYEFHVRAFDAAGNAGDWSAVVSTIIPFDQTVAKYSSGWKVAKNSNYYLGSARYTTKKGAYATTSFTKGTLYLVTKTGPKLGKLAVYYRGKKVGTVDLHSKSTKYRQVFKLISKTSGSASTVKLVSLGVSGHKQVEIDGLALKR